MGQMVGQIIGTPRGENAIVEKLVDLGCPDGSKSDKSDGSLMEVVLSMLNSITNLYLEEIVEDAFRKLTHEGEDDTDALGGGPSIYDVEVISDSDDGRPRSTDALAGKPS